MLIRYSLILLTALAIQPVFAHEDMSNSNDKSCATIVKACLDGGYTRENSDNKQFWKDCLRPLLLGKAVTGITVDTSDVNQCRTAKIAELEAELSDLKKAN